MKNNRILTTTDYKMFKFLKDNRELRPEKIKDLSQSISKYGLLQPIIVNEKMQVMDGQHRLRVCIELGLPIDYKLSEGMTIEHVRAMNSVQTNWSNVDYMRSFAHKNDNYRQLMELNEEFSEFNLSTIITYASMSAGGKSSVKKFNSGEFVIRDLRKTRAYLNFLRDLSNKTELYNSRSFTNALLFFLQIPEFDPQLFIHKLDKKGGLLRGHTKTKDFKKAILDIYNHSNRAKLKVLIE